MRFCDVKGHADLKRRLAAGIDGGRISHAQLFVGAAGSGTLPLALAYTQYLHCTNRQNGEAYMLAGYPWFKCRARDMFISLPGLSLAIDERAKIRGGDDYRLQSYTLLHKRRAKRP